MHRWRGLLVHTTFVLAQPIYLAVRHLIKPDYFSSAPTSWLAITAITWLYLVTQISIPFFTSPLRHVPSPLGERLLTAHLNFNGGKPPTDNISSLVEETPNDGLIVLWGPLFLWAQIVPTRPDTLMEMLNTHNYDWEKPALSKKLLARTLGKGLVNVEGHEHKAMRKVVAPAFSGHHIRELVPLFYSKGLDFAESMAREASRSADGAVEMMHQMSLVTLDIIGLAGLGKDFNTIENNDDPLAKSYAAITGPDRGPLWLFLFLTYTTPVWVLRKLRGTPYARITNAQAKLRNDVRALVQEKKRIMQDKAEQQKDIIAIIMRSGDYSDDYLVDQLLTFLAAGHDTTASALTWTTWLLALNPQIQDRLRAECTVHLSQDPSSPPDASTFDPETTPYLSAVCNETLRLYPTVPATARHAIRPTTINTYRIPTGTEALISPWAMNRSPALWGPDATEYNPDRWLTGPDAATGGAKTPYALVTFLHGPRSCIGQGFARLEMRCLLAALVMRFRFEIVEGEKEVEVGGFVTIKPRGGLRLRLVDLGGGRGAKA